MDKLINDVLIMRLPPGFRFHPTDEELVVQQLKRKVLSSPLPALIIREVDGCKSEPWDLPGDSEQERYFFSRREVKYSNGIGSKRATGSGYWKATGLDKQIVSSRSHQIVGMKKTLVFYRGKPPKGCRTDWIMHEYRLISSAIATNSLQSKHNNLRLPQGNCVLCRVFLKRRRNMHMMIDDEPAAAPTQIGPRVFYDLMAKDQVRARSNLLPAPDSPSGSSGITEISSNNQSDDHREESTSTCNTFARKQQCLRL